MHVIAHTLSKEELLRQKDEQIIRIREQWRIETDEVHRALAKEKHSVSELRTEVKHLEMARDKRQAAGKDPQEHNLYGLYQQNAVLSRRIEDMITVMSFTKLKVLEPNFPEPSLVEKLIVRMGDALEHILHDHVFVDPPEAPTNNINGDLSALISSVFDETDGVNRNRLLERCIAKHDPEIWVRTFAVAAVRDWVFASDFPNFGPQDVRLLRAYRSAVVTQGMFLRPACPN